MNRSGLLNAARSYWTTLLHWLIFAIVLCAGLYIRLLAVDIHFDANHIAPEDETKYYYTPARNLLEGRGFLQNGPEAGPPLQGIFMYTLLRLSPSTTFRDMRMVQVAIAIAGLICAYSIGRLTCNRWAGLLFMACLSWNGEVARLAAHLLTENNFLALLFASLLALLIAMEKRRPLLFCIAGVLFGLTTLQRFNALLLPLVVLPITASLGFEDWRRKVIFSVAFLGSFLMVIAPWAIRNSRIYGEPVLTSTNSGRVLALANYKNLNIRETRFFEEHYYTFGWRDPGLEAKSGAGIPDTEPFRKILALDRAYGNMAKEYMLQNPGHFMKNFAWRFLYQLYEPRGLALPEYAPYKTLNWHQLHLFVPVLVPFGIFFLIWQRRDRAALLMITTFAYFAFFGALFHLTKDGRMNLVLRILEIYFASCTVVYAIGYGVSALKRLATRFARGPAEQLQPSHRT